MNVLKHARASNTGFLEYGLPAVELTVDDATLEPPKIDARFGVLERHKLECTARTCVYFLIPQDDRSDYRKFINQAKRDILSLFYENVYKAIHETRSALYRGDIALAVEKLDSLWSDLHNTDVGP